MIEWVKLDRIGGINGSGIYFYSLRKAYSVKAKAEYMQFQDGWKLCWTISTPKWTCFNVRAEEGDAGDTKEGTLCEWSDKKMFLKVAGPEVLDQFMVVERKQYEQERLDNRDASLYFLNVEMAFLKIHGGKIQAVRWSDYVMTRQPAQTIQPAQGEP